jgi:hypothetical protein
MTHYPVKVFDGQDWSEATLIVDLAGGKNSITYMQNINIIKAEHEHPFFALAEIRLELEKKGLKILCNGAKRNVYPSGMSAIGELAYELKIGKQAKKQVNIFHEAKEIKDIATVNEQKEFWKAWLESLGKG